MIEVITRTFTPEILTYLLGGAWLVIELSVVIVICSIFFGLILALLRSYDKFILGRLAGVYIEVFRNTPNLMWVLICYVYAPLPTAFLRCAFAFVLFTSATIAEIIRGGLNSIPRGQFEAASSQGFSFVQTLISIILPQCFQNIVPTLLSQMITTIKDSSYMASLVTVELMACTKLIISKANSYNGTWVDRFNRGTINVTDVFVLFGFAFLVYFAINFTLSCVVRRMRTHKRV